MICIIALIVFGILGIFSAAHRKLAKEALDCVARRVVLRPCETGFDQMIKSLVVGKFLRFPCLARPLYRHFESFSWLLIGLMIVSTFFIAQGAYNYAKYGNCNGSQGGFCIYDSLDGKSELKNPGPDDDPGIGPIDAPVQIIEFGCFKCSFTREADKVIWQVMEEYPEKIRFVYRDFPLSARHRGAVDPSLAADCVLEQDQSAYWQYRGILFQNQNALSNEDLAAYAQNISIDLEQWKECFDSGKHLDEVEHDYEDGLEAGVYGTPTFFINNQSFVGPQSYKTFKRVIEKELEKAGVT